MTKGGQFLMSLDNLLVVVSIRGFSPLRTALENVWISRRGLADLL